MVSHQAGGAGPSALERALSPPLSCCPNTLPSLGEEWAEVLAWRGRKGRGQWSRTPSPSPSSLSIPEVRDLALFFKARVLHLLCHCVTAISAQAKLLL